MGGGAERRQRQEHQDPFRGRCHMVDNMLFLVESLWSSWSEISRRPSPIRATFLLGGNMTTSTTSVHHPVVRPVRPATLFPSFLPSRHPPNKTKQSTDDQAVGRLSEIAGEPTVAPARAVELPPPEREPGRHGAPCTKQARPGCCQVHCLLSFVLMFSQAHQIARSASHKKLPGSARGM